jgi:hypothetical protein
MGRKWWKKVVDPINITGATRDAVTGYGTFAKPKTKLGKGIQSTAKTVKGSGEAIKETVVPGYARRKSAKAQEEAQKSALGLQSQMWEDVKGMQQPYLDVGTDALSRLAGYTHGGAFDTPIEMPQYDRLPLEQFGGYQPVEATREYDQIPISREYDPIARQSGYEELSPERYQADSWSLDNLAQDPGYQFRLKQGQEAITSAAGAGGNRLSGGTLKALAEYGQGLASEEAGKAYDRFRGERAFDYGAERDYQADLRDERGFKYGAGRDLMGDLERERAFKYGTGQDYLSNLAAERGFKYGTGRDYRQDLLGERAAQYGAGQDYLANLAGERGFQRQTIQDHLANYSGEMQNRYNRLANLANVGQVASQSLGGAGMQAGQGMANTMGNIGMAKGLGYMAPQQGIMDLLGMGGNIGSMLMGGRAAGWWGQ